MDRSSQLRELRSVDELSRADRELVEAAQQASGSAYAPYSGFAVGAAVRCKNGKVYMGANLENASYGLSICAEVTAIAAANTDENYDIVAIAIVGHKFMPYQDATLVVTPCGRCRQLISEASQISATDVRILSCNGDLMHIEESRISGLLPFAFGPANLGLHEVWPRMRRELKASLSKLLEKHRRKSA